MLISASPFARIPLPLFNLVAPFHSMPILTSCIYFCLVLLLFPFMQLHWCAWHRKDSDGRMSCIIVGNVIINVDFLHFNRIFYSPLSSTDNVLVAAVIVHRRVDYRNFQCVLVMSAVARGSRDMRIFRNGNEWLLFFRPVFCLHTLTLWHITHVMMFHGPL